MAPILAVAGRDIRSDRSAKRNTREIHNDRQHGDHRRPIEPPDDRRGPRGIRNG